MPSLMTTTSTSSTALLGQAVQQLGPVLEPEGAGVEVDEPVAQAGAARHSFSRGRAGRSSSGAQFSITVRFAAVDAPRRRASARSRR